MFTAGQTTSSRCLPAFASFPLCLRAAQQPGSCPRLTPFAHRGFAPSIRIHSFVGQRERWTRYPHQRGHQRLSAMESGDLALGLQAPNFELPEPLTGKTVSLDDSVGTKAILVMFICNHCPFVIHLERAIVDLVNHFKPQGLHTFAISSNSIVTHPQDAPEKMAEKAKALGYPFPYLYDATQEVAKAYGAVCTPEFYIFDSERRLVYHGRFDASTPRNGQPITGGDLRGALEDVLAGRPVQRTMRCSIGCGIKWHPA